MPKKKNRSAQLPKAVDPEKQKEITVDLLDRARVFMFGIIQFADVEDIGEAEETFMREASILWALGMLGEMIDRVKQNDSGIVKRYPDFPWYTLGTLTYKTDFEEEFEDNYYWLIYVYRARILNIIDLENGFDVENMVIPPWIRNIDYLFYDLESTSGIHPESSVTNVNEIVSEENITKREIGQIESKRHSDTIAW